MKERFGLRVPLWRTAGFVVVAAAFLAAGASAATDSDVGCGDTITQNTKLDHDLIDCPGDGLVIGADDVTLDLGGHTLDGSGGGVGVDNSAGHDGVTIERGAVRDFGRGVQLYGTRRNVVRRLLIEAGTGVALVDDLQVAEENAIERNTIRGRDLGVLVEAGPNNRVERNDVSGAQVGIGLYYVGTGTRVERNRLSGNFEGIVVSDSFNPVLVAENVAVDNCVGISIFDTNRARIEENTVLRSGESCRGLVGGTGRPGDGINSRDGRGENVIEANVVRGSLDDGIDVEHADVVAENKADRNGDLGIEAEPEVVDGGGNRAKGNGNPLQCLNVACS